MSNIKNKETIYAVMRNDLALDKDVVCCFVKTLIGAEELCGEYQQQWEDSGGGEESYYYVVGNIFYDK